MNPHKGYPSALSNEIRLVMGPNVSGPMEFQRLSSGQNAEKTIMAKIFFTLT